MGGFSFVGMLLLLGQIILCGHAADWVDLGFVVLWVVEVFLRGLLLILRPVRGYFITLDEARDKVVGRLSGAFAEFLGIG